ncbi:cysteine synthase family protein [Kibdelosporangium philippinense]|uniref:Cysteine synthase family protein n=1 Tax=Kibdelosporangium philippinense TaxID=211113 RepID=A0ABS8ZE89_9PSEU|nr:cysteine synthase family protein [Kibdelosporangium philippinense]MCE7004152.1 cysteine synthase family protein [Kibdelosporangium philippinense]
MAEQGLLAGIGWTRAVRLDGLTGANDAEVWVKLEAANPTGSYKDRMALAMIRGAEQTGRLRPGQIVVEATGGSTGASLAMVCALTGHPLRVVTSDAFALEKLSAMRAFGADVDMVTSPPGGFQPELWPQLIELARLVADQVDGFATDQFHNQDVINAYKPLGYEVAAQVPGQIDAFCVSVGTGGCLIGAGRALRQRFPEMLRVAVEPAESPVLSGGEPGTHQIEGAGIGFWPPLLESYDFDEVISVTSADALEMARVAAAEYGLFSGPSTGANLVAAARLARRLGSGHRVLTVQVDSGLKYLSSGLFE